MTSPPETTQRYRASDAAPTLDIFRRAIDITAAQDYSDEQRRAWAPDDLPFNRWGTERSAARTWVAVVRLRVVGFTDLSPDGHIGMLYVDPDFARCGVASQLLTVLFATAEAESLPELTVDASQTARPLLRRHGFTTEAGQQVERRGVILTNYRMRRSTLPGSASNLST